MTQLRLDRLMSNLGYGSRKEIAALTHAGRIALHGVELTDASRSVSLADAASGALTLDNEAIDPPSPLTVMLHKPQGYSCSHDEKGPLVYDLLPSRWKLRKPALSCAGRLDKDSTGQVILTDDGMLLHRIIHPKSHAAKHYAVTLEQALQGNEADLFAGGDFLMKGDTKPLKPALWKAEGEKNGHMILQEGRYHQIRRMFETLGNHVVALHRYRTCELGLMGLAEGQYRILGAEDIARIFAVASPKR